jgi:ADP-heptose:LPS heptosyltransferase
VSGNPRILVIKLSSLGDFVQAMGPFAAIRAHHPDAHITLLTTRPYVEFAAASPWFNEVWEDRRPKAWDVAGLMRLRNKLRSVRFDMVYDLQTSDRSSSYFHLMRSPKWSGIAQGCSNPHANPERDLMHTIDRQAEQLAMAGIDRVGPPSLAWVQADLGRFKLPRRYALMVPGGAVHRPAKRWPAVRYAELAEMLSQRAVTPVLIGTAQDDERIDAILALSSKSMSLSGQTSFADIVALARGASAAIGNDTGPMHLIAAAGCPSVVLFSSDSDPNLCAPRGPVTVIARDDLAELAIGPVLVALEAGPAQMRG